MSAAWSWALVDGTGAPVTATTTPSDFPSQSEAESWLGESWPDLLDAGVGAVTLMRHGEEVYGPMSLQPPQSSGGSW